MAQQISSTTGSTPDQLVQQALDNDCVQILNVQSVNNGSVDGITSFGSFNRGTTAFPFVNGFLLTTGNAASAGNGFIGPDLNDGTTAWTGDVDLEAALGISNTLNATVIEFDLISVTDRISFNYLLASEEYQLDFPCNVSDGFALLIRPTGSTAPYQNLAIIPGTNTAVGIDTVHPEIVGQCAASNPTFFEGTNIGHTNYAGRTVPFTATATVIPNVSYHLKMVVADQLDFRADTAIFIESGSLTADVNLGPDQTPCENTTLDASVGNPLAQYNWYLNGNLLPSETSATLFVTTSGNYRVDVTIPSGASSCIISDDVLVVIDPNQLSLNLNDLFACDDASNDGLETFDLAAERSIILATLGAGNYNVAFYETNANAINGTNALANSYTNTSNGQTIYVRVNNTDSGCYGISTVVLQVNSVPVATDATYEQCDEDADGIAVINLSAIDALVSTNSNPVTITYHSSINGAVNGTAALTSGYTNSTNPETIFARVTDTATGCYDTSMVIITVNPAPELPITSTYIDACDQDYDGFAIFNLTSVENQFTAGLSNVNASYHLTAQEAIDGTNPIAAPNTFLNTTARLQNIFIRVTNASGCASTGTIRLFTNYLLDATDVEDVETCDDITNDGFESFDLESIETDFLNGVDDIEIYFYTSESDQLADINRLDETNGFTNTVNPQTIWLRLESVTCTEFLSVEFIVVPYFASQPVSDQTYCDEDQDQLTTVLLNVFDDAVRAPFTADYAVVYYATQADAINRENAITTFTNATPSFTVWAQTINPSGCADQQPLNITVLPAPLATDPSPIIICDNDTDGFFIIDLTAQQSQINTEANRTITYHNTLLDANEGTNTITNPSSYTAQTETVYVRVENTTTGCFNIATQSVIVNTLPVFVGITLYNICESDGDGFESFLISTKTAEILNGQTGKDVSYHLTAQDAMNNTNAIDPNTGYTNISSPQTIHVRVENTSDTSCFGTSSFQIEVNETPRYNAPTNLERCDDNNDGRSIFDLQTTMDQIRFGVTDNLTITFYNSTSDANSQNNPLSLQYTNQSNPETIVARIGNDQQCYELESFTLNVVDAPLVNAVSASVTCDDNYDGLSSFDLRFRESEIVGSRPFNSIITWHIDLADANAGNNEISNSDNFANTSNPQTVYLRIFNTVSGCYALAPLELQVSTPPAISNFTEYIICDNPRNEADLTAINTSFINPIPSNVQISYFQSNIDAQNDVNQLPVPYNYTSSTTSLFARILNTDTGCFYVAPFNLLIQDAPVLPVAGSYDLEFCDDDFDGFLMVDLTQNRDIVFSGVDASTHTLTYFLSQDDAVNNSNPITTPQDTSTNTTYYVRLTNNALGCSSIGSFAVIINPLPDPPLSDYYVICDEFIDIDASTGETGERYLWSTGETTPIIRIDAPGTYFVTITSSNGCVSPRARFLVEQSSTANIEFIATVNFNDPNSITVVVNGIGDYLYILDNGTPQRSNVFPNVTRGYHDVQVIDINGCEPTPPQRVLIIDYPKFFTPNSDGFNDFWQVDDIETFDQATFYIFDRHGKLLKNFDKNSQGWDGNYNGNPMPSSDYWFTIEIKDSRGDFNVKGHFSLKR